MNIVNSDDEDDRLLDNLWQREQSAMANSRQKLSLGEKIQLKSWETLMHI
jgi:hypothetical protein